MIIHVQAQLGQAVVKFSVMSVCMLKCVRACARACAFVRVRAWWSGMEGVHLLGCGQSAGKCVRAHAADRPPYISKL